MLIDRIRTGLSEKNRKRARRLADGLLSTVGSISGAMTPSNRIALTFDDGPDPDVTPRLLDLLAARDAKATFFVLTCLAERHPGIVRRIVNEGHEIALHADRHERLTDLPIADVLRRLKAARATLEDMAGQPIRLFRPPFGSQSLSTYLATRFCGLDVVVWGPYAEDWVERAPEAVAERGLSDLRPGQILLLHDGLEMPDGETRPTFDRVRAFELILDGLSARGISGITVSDLIAEGGPRRTAWFRG
jgi:peptidoglycan/xylan/chitin deacetylase (PgdA/CDA1 family)